VCLEPPDVADDFEYEPVSYEDRFLDEGVKLGAGRGTAYAVLSVMARLGPCYVAEIADELGVGGTYSFAGPKIYNPDRDARRRYNSIAKCLERMARRGEVVAMPDTDGHARRRVYALPEAA
jgi:hypothetical protein